MCVDVCSCVSCALCTCVGVNIHKTHISTIAFYGQLLCIEVYYYNRSLIQQFSTKHLVRTQHTFSTSPHTHTHTNTTLGNHLIHKHNQCCFQNNPPPTASLQVGRQVLSHENTTQPILYSCNTTLW